ncbi:MAG TPA: hypothetical protein G4O02_17295 [Caldilineae bacterium]|jgi:hypothetical protein|nr:hypothetical protein [Caldilineae bacterium]
MLDELRQRISRYLDGWQTAVLSACSWGRPWLIPVQYRHRELEIECLLPRWAELFSYLDRDPEVLLIVRSTDAAETSRWLEYRGRAAVRNAPDWTVWNLSPEEQEQPQDRYVVLRITPRRIDLIDESRGWGFRETLDL